MFLALLVIQSFFVFFVVSQNNLNIEKTLKLLLVIWDMRFIWLNCNFSGSYKVISLYHLHFTALTDTDFIVPDNFQGLSWKTIFRYIQTIPLMFVEQQVQQITFFKSIIVKILNLNHCISTYVLFFFFTDNTNFPDDQKQLFSRKKVSYNPMSLCKTAISPLLMHWRCTVWHQAIETILIIILVW